MTSISRRDLFRSFLGRSRAKADATPPATEVPSTDITKPVDTEPPLALILDRFCLAHQNSFCSVCVERCPVPGAIITVQGKPRIQPDVCTGCRICHEICPAPRNAVFLVSRKPRQGMVALTTESPTHD